MTWHTGLAVALLAAAAAWSVLAGGDERLHEAGGDRYHLNRSLIELSSPDLSLEPAPVGEARSGGSHPSASRGS